jgi:site-specific DNA recombinase
MNVALYARVSQPSIQDTEDKVSIDQQLAEQRALCERNGWQIVGEFVDRENYKATQNPKRGKIVNPSGERTDRPQFLAMLGLVKAGDVDIVLCWRDDRLVRHPRVAVALEDALDIGDAQRNGRPKTEIRDATGATIDRFTLSIKATIWREENKRRVDRTHMGKIATLQQGHWPGTYHRYGYQARKLGGRGRVIEVVEDEAQVVRKVHEMFDAGMGTGSIRRYLVAEDVPQVKATKHVWDMGAIYRILHSEDYTGSATWKFRDNTRMSIEIPAIIDRDLWKRNQARIERNKVLCPRNASGVYLLQGLIECGECGVKMRVNKKRFSYVGGKKRTFPIPKYDYICGTVKRYPEEPHAAPYSRYGPTLDWRVWRRVVDYGVKRPELIREQVMARQAELQAQGDSVDGDVAHARRRLVEVDSERAFYQRQAARDRMTEGEFDARMEETEETRRYGQSELARLQELRDNRDKVQAGLDYATKLLTTIQRELPRIDIPYSELKKLPEKEREEILRMRKEIVRALIDKVVVYADGRVKIHGLLDGSEAAQFDLDTLTSDAGRV